MAYGTNKKKIARADSLMNESIRKKKIASEQEKIAKAFIKSGNAYKTKVIDLKGTTTPTAYERLKRASNIRQSASKDSSMAVSIRKQIKKSK
jgi:hypothetical protein